VPARNAVLSTVPVAESDDRRNQRVARLEVADGDRDVQDQLGGDPWNGGAPDVLDVESRVTERVREAGVLLGEALRPHRSDGHQAQFTRVQAELRGWVLRLMIHRA
jgi:hypothetical protein